MWVAGYVHHTLINKSYYAYKKWIQTLECLYTRMVNSNMSCVVISYYLVVTPKTTTRKTHTIQILQKEWIQEECREEEVETTELNVKSGGDWQFNDLFRKVVRSHYKNQATAYKQLKKKWSESTMRGLQNWMWEAEITTKRSKIWSAINKRWSVQEAWIF